MMLVEPDLGVVLGPHEPGGWVRPCRCTPAAALGKLLCAPLHCGPQQDLQLCSPTPCMALRQPVGAKRTVDHFGYGQDASIRKGGTPFACLIRQGNSLTGANSGPIVAAASSRRSFDSVQAHRPCMHCNSYRLACIMKSKSTGCLRVVLKLLQQQDSNLTSLHG